MVTSIGLGYEAQLVDQVLQWRVAGNTAWNTVDTPVTAAKYRLDGGGTYVRLQYIGDWSYNGGAGPTGGVFTAPATAISPSFTATRGGSNTDWTSQLTAADIPAETTTAKNTALTFLDHVDFARLEARNMVTHRLAVPPISPTIGQGYYDTGLSKRGTWNGYQWDYGLSDDRPIGTLNAGVSLRGYEPIVTVTATKTLALSDSGTVQNCTNAAAAIITIPLNTNVAYPIGARIIIRKTTSQTVTVAWATGVTVLNSLGTTLTVTGVTSSNILRQTSIDTWISYPDLPESTIGGALRVAVDAPTARTTIGLSAVTNVPLAEPRATATQIGTNAGISNTTGTGWTSIGLAAGRNNISGSNWLAIGSNAGTNATASNWTAIGANAGTTNTNGTGWTAIGSSAGTSSTTGISWTAIGSNAGRNNTGGGYWTAIGGDAGFTNVSGYGWVAIGPSAGRLNVSSGDWIAIGSSAGYNATGNQWTAIGGSSGLDITTGNANVTIGYNTGRGITTGSGNTIVGTGVVGLAAALTNNVILSSGDGVIKLQIDSTGLTTLLISPVASDNSNIVATTAHVKNVLLNNVATAALGNVSLQASNTTQVARSCRPIVIVSRTTAFTFTTTYTDLIFNNTIRDNSSAYNTTTGIFTAPYAGIYSFSCLVSNFAAVSSYTLVGVGSAANTEVLRLGLSGTSVGAYQVISGRQLVFMNSGDTRRFGVQVGGTNAAGSPEATATSQTACYMSIEYLGIDT